MFCVVSSTRFFGCRYKKRLVCTRIFVCILGVLFEVGCRNIAFMRVKERFSRLKANTLGVARTRRAVDKYNPPTPIRILWNFLPEITITYSKNG